MGNTFEVHCWVAEGGVSDKSLRNLHYELAYTGESLFVALWVMWKEKRKGVGCVKFYWR